MSARFTSKDFELQTGVSNQKATGNCVINIGLLQRYCRDIIWIDYRGIYCIQFINMKLSDRKTAEGTTRLTDHIIGKMQNQYGEALRNNSNILLYMKRFIFFLGKRRL